MLEDKPPEKGGAGRQTDQLTARITLCVTVIMYSYTQNYHIVGILVVIKFGETLNY